MNSLKYFKKNVLRNRWVFQNTPSPGPETSSGDKNDKNDTEKGASEASEVARQNPSDMAAAAVATAGKVASQFTGMTTQLKTALFQKDLDPSILLQSKATQANKQDQNEKQSPSQKN